MMQREGRHTGDRSPCSLEVAPKSGTEVSSCRDWLRAHGKSSLEKGLLILCYEGREACLPQSPSSSRGVGGKHRSPTCPLPLIMDGARLAGCQHSKQESGLGDSKTQDRANLSCLLQLQGQGPETP